VLVAITVYAHCWDFLVSTSRLLSIPAAVILIRLLDRVLELAPGILMSHVFSSPRDVSSSMISSFMASSSQVIWFQSRSQDRLQRNLIGVG